MGDLVIKKDTKAANVEHLTIDPPRLHGWLAFVRFTQTNVWQAVTPKPNGWGLYESISTVAPWPLYESREEALSDARKVPGAEEVKLVEIIE